MLIDELIILCVEVEILFSRKGSRSNSWGAGGLCVLKLPLKTSLTSQAEFDKQRIRLNSQFPGTERLPNTCNFSIQGPQLQGDEGLLVSAWGGGRRREQSGPLGRVSPGGQAGLGRFPLSLPGLFALVQGGAALAPS